MYSDVCRLQLGMSENFLSLQKETSTHTGPRWVGLRLEAVVGVVGSNSANPAHSKYKEGSRIPPVVSRWVPPI